MTVKSSPPLVPLPPGWVWWPGPHGHPRAWGPGTRVVRAHNYTVLTARIGRVHVDGVRIELADPEGQLLEEIANPVMTAHDVRLTYRLALRSMDRVDWPKVNKAIIGRWDVPTLVRIKAFAWKEGPDGDERGSPSSSAGRLPGKT